MDVYAGVGRRHLHNNETELLQSEVLPPAPKLRKLDHHHLQNLEEEEIEEGLEDHEQIHGIYNEEVVGTSTAGPHSSSGNGGGRVLLKHNEELEDYDNMEEIDDSEEIIEYVEETIMGEILLGEDGQFYVVTDKNSPEIDIDKLNNVQVILNKDGTESLILEDASQKDFNNPNKLRGPGYRKAHDGLDIDDMEGDEGIGEPTIIESEETKFLKGKQARRHRVYGDCTCPDCGQTFVNTARLERHLAVHQIFGSYLCPLCGKTYKYEYNLFYHWRKTCRDLNELMSAGVRKNLEVNNLRQIVEEIVQKKANIGPLQLGLSDQFGISSQHLFRNQNNMLLDRPDMAQAHCKDCGVRTLEAHLPRHEAIHRGEAFVGESSVAGGFFCDLCGVVFRQHFNLIKHWRTGCRVIRANLPESYDVVLDDEALKQMVYDLLRKASITSFKSKEDRKKEIDAQNQEILDLEAEKKALESQFTNPPLKHTSSNYQNELELHVGHNEVEEGIPTSNGGTAHKLPISPPDPSPQLRATTSSHEILEEEEELAEDAIVYAKNETAKDFHKNRSIKLADSRAPRAGDPSQAGEPPVVADLIDVVSQPQTSTAPDLMRDELQYDEKWVDETGLFFQDDILDEEMLMINDEGQLCPVERDRSGGILSGGGGGNAGGGNTSSVVSYHYQQFNPLDNQQGYGPTMTVQCQECYRSFANITRLERHLAGAHSNNGTHHCVLCGNRFKYDYNLLYHYRRSCPYTKAMIQQEVREQMDATNLKKLVRRLATKDLHHGFPVNHNLPQTLSHRQELGDSQIRRQMMNNIYPQNSHQQPVTSSGLHLPQNLHAGSSRVGLSEGQLCPSCGINFYGRSALTRHMKMVHPNDYDIWEQDQSVETVDNMDPGKMHHMEEIETETLIDEEGNQVQPDDPSQFEAIEPPPTLQPEPGVEEEDDEGGAVGELSQQERVQNQAENNFESF